MSHPLPGHDENVAAAQELMRSANEAEQRQDYSRAVEIYNQLRSFPDYARPKDLDQRIRNVKSKAAPLPWATSQPSA